MFLYSLVYACMDAVVHYWDLLSITFKKQQHIISVTLYMLINFTIYALYGRSCTLIGFVANKFKITTTKHY